MIARAVLPSIFFFACSAAGAAVFKRDGGCNNFPTNGVSNNADYFSLWAQYDQTGTEIPLAMGTFATSAPFTGAVLATADYSGATVGSLFQLNNSGLVGIGYPDGNDQTATWIAHSTEDGGPVPFALSPSGSLAGIDEDYCEVVSTDPNGSPFPGPLLAAEGTADDWSICNRTSNPAQMGLVLRAATWSADYGYNFPTCQPVHVFLRSFTIGNEP
ncbi:hypothetical protein GYMLUDRAFT_78128 [Collybiopsis luxurians FD-317 M1]|uniref:Unplaced genomic scaffold GYMLUscaffold_111, whole genome shotgun sequence n=1 Tax=Collybiopsis luxurians FD-317 M1 TaxID=944289 RepID=A0A0D0BB91_9AGAR|nr:hypothetical protein GYMLUDRAFT_78128 [Collybiopsis luxurians FD-317 M1]